MNKDIQLHNNSIMDHYKKTDNILLDMQSIIDSAQKHVYKAVNSLLVQRNWLLGYRIAEEELQGENRAEYGLGVIQSLSKALTKLYGKGYTKGHL